MKYLLSALFFLITTSSLIAKESIQIKLKSGETITGETSKSLFEVGGSSIPIKDEKTGEKMKIEVDDIESAIVTDKKGRQFTFSRFPNVYPGAAVFGKTIYSAFGQEVVSSEGVSMYLQYMYVEGGGGAPSRREPLYYVYSPDWESAIKLDAGGIGVNLGKPYKQVLIEIFGDDPDTRTRIENKDYRKKKIADLIHSYNKNKGYESTQYELLDYKY